MKSTSRQLETRGYASNKEIQKFINKTNSELKDLLKNENAVKRTIAAVIIGERKRKDSLPLLCNSLKTEKKLYTKIALCEALEKYGISSINYLLPLLGLIGKNQHKKPVLADLKKKSFPLPRDIVARIIIRIGKSALPFLENIIINGNYNQKTEAIDAIGHIAFNNYDYRSEGILLNLYKNTNDELIKWKLIRAFKAFNSNEIKIILEEIVNNDNMIFQEEAKRSIEQIKRRKT